MKRIKFQNMVEKSRPQKRAITKIKKYGLLRMRRGGANIRMLLIDISKLAEDNIL